MGQLSDSSKKKIQHLSRLLSMEKEEDAQRHRQILEEYRLEERCERGWSWYPVQVTDYGYTFGDNAYVTVQHTTASPAGSKFKSGTPVRIYDAEQEEYEIEGTVHFLKKEEMKIILRGDDYPDWILSGKYVVEQLFDATTYKAMERALKAAAKSEGRFAELIEYLWSDAEPEQKDGPLSIDLPTLNESQKQAVIDAVQTEAVGVIHGPPGTGKTTTLGALIQHLVHFQNKILVCAPSNTAVDLLASSLSAKGLKVVRLGHISRVEEDILSLTLDGQLAAHPESKQIKDLKIQAAEIRRQAGKFKRQFGPKERAERQEKFKEARELMHWSRELEKRLIAQIIIDAQVVCTTLVNAQHSVISDTDFDYTIIDEAGQAMDPALLIPLERTHKWIMAGDPFQLPPTIKSIDAAREGLSVNMLERWIQSNKRSSLLKKQYRMNEVIMGFSNQQFYEGALQAADSVSQWTLRVSAMSDPFEFIDTAGCGFEEKVETESRSRYNEDEARIIREHFLQLVTAYENQGKILPSIGMITPYRAQVAYLKSLWMEDEDTQKYMPYLTIDSIDGFQGAERDIIYISLVRSNEQNEIGFLKDYRRMNVALTRARKKLIVVGDSATLGADAFYKNLLSYVDTHATYRSAWEFMA